MFGHHSLQVKVVKTKPQPATDEPKQLVLDLSQITSEEARQAFLGLFAAYAAVKILNTACKVAVITAMK